MATAPATSDVPSTPASTPAGAATPAEAATPAGAAPETKAPRVIFCLPGRTYSREFLLSWSGLMSECLNRGIVPVMSQQYSSVVHFARTKCLGGDVLKGADQKPFQGQVDYDYIMWIDSDIVFHPNEFFKLLESPHDVTAGVYMMEDRKHYAVVKSWDEEYFRANGTFQFIDQAALDADEERYQPVSYSGMGWMLMKKGVVESLTYPWFTTELQQFPDRGDGKGALVDMCSEDVALCHKLGRAGHRVMIDKTVRVGHQKAVIL